MRISRRALLAASSLLLATPSLCADDESEADDSFEFDEFTDESQRSIDQGNQWLMRAMHRDGSCGVDIGQPSDIGCTSMVGLAWLSQGNTPVEGQYARQVLHIASYLLQCVEVMPSDDITTAVGTQLQGKIGRHAHTFFATLFLSQVIGEGWDPELVRRALDELVQTVARSQTAAGHWGQESWAPTLGTVMGWSCLRGAHFAGFRVEASIEKVTDHLVRQMSQQLSQNNGNWMHNLYKNATGIRVLYAMGQEDEPIARRAMADVVRLVTQDNTPFTQAGGEEYLSFHLITETLLQKGGQEWRQWYPVVRDKLIRAQNSDGSWSGAHCITSRTFCTAAACLVLSAPNRYLPISQL